MSTKLTEADFKWAADQLGCEVAAVKAVAEVESRGDAFLPSGEPVILFEPHIFHREIQKVGLQPADFLPKYSDILYPRWGTKPYGKMSEQHGKLQKATAIHKEAALKSCSWGMFQLMGFNHKLCGYPELQGFINDMYAGEAGHLRAFVGFVKAAYLNKHIRDKNWAAFARGYNGAEYAKHGYHTKLAAAYQKHS